MYTVPHLTVIDNCFYVSGVEVMDALANRRSSQSGSQMNKAASGPVKDDMAASNAASIPGSSAWGALKASASQKSLLAMENAGWPSGSEKMKSTFS